MLEVKPPQKETTVQTVPTQELIGKLDEVFDERLNAMREHYRQWQLNLAFIRGRQWSTWDRVRGRIVDLRPSKASQARVVFNLIGPFVRSTISMLSGSNPVMDVIPASISSKDENAAKSGQIHLDRIAVINHKSVNDVLLRKNITACGIGYKMDYWDLIPNMEEFNEAPPETLDDLKQMGKAPQPIPVKNEKDEEKTKQREQRGECAEIIPSPFEILINYPLIKNDSDIRDFFRYRLVSLDYLKNSWTEGKYVEAESLANYNILSEIVGGNNELFSRSANTNQAILKEYFEAPSKDYPRGRHIQWANGVLLHDGRLSHPKGKLGLFCYHWDIDAIDFFGTSYVEPLIEPQVIINRIFSKLTNWLDKSIRFRVAVPKNAQFSRSKSVSADDGSVYEYNNIGGTGMINIPIAQIPPGLFTFLDQTISNFKDIASRHASSSGDSQGRLSGAGKAIRSLQEADSQYLVPAMIVWEEREREAALFMLDLMRHYYRKARTARIIGESRKVELFSLEGVDLNPEIDINIVKGSSMPKSKVAQQSFIMELYQMGLMGDPQNPEVQKKVLRNMDVGGIEAVYGSVELGVNLQQMELMAMRESGQYIPAQAFHDHYTHNGECLKELNMPGFEEQEQQYKNMVIRHWQEHVQFIVAMNQGIIPGSVEEPKPAPMPGAGGKLGLPEAVNPQAQQLRGQ